VEETSNAMALDGIMFEGVSVRVRRPNDYNPAAAAALGPSVPNPNLNLSAIGLQAGGMNAVTPPEPFHAMLLAFLCHCAIAMQRVSKGIRYLMGLYCRCIL
jgi:hypothetical protein